MANISGRRCEAIGDRDRAYFGIRPCAVARYVLLVVCGYTGVAVDAVVICGAGGVPGRRGAGPARRAVKCRRGWVREVDAGSRLC